MSDSRTYSLPPASTSQDVVTRELTDAEREHFNSIPWARSILQQSLHQHQPNSQRTGSKSAEGNGEYDIIYMPARVFKDHTDEDGYFAGTLGTDKTIPFLITLRRRNLGAVLDSLPKEPPTAMGIDSKSKRTLSPSRPPDSIMLISLATPGLSGHPETAHGGVIASLFDEAMSHAIDGVLPLNPPEAESTPASGGVPERGAIYTAQLNVRFKKPVKVPGLLVIRSWCVARNGRKCWVLAQAVQEEQEDRGGQLEWVKRKTIRAEASALWVIVRNEKL